jgi:hypothetical protein
MVRIGVLLVIIGFGSTVLHSSTDYQFTLVAWADGMQPYAGIIIGLIGVGLLATPFVLRAREGSPGSPISPAAAFGQPANGAPMSGGFAAPQTGPGGFPQPAPWEQQAGFGQQPAPQQFGQQQQFGQPQFGQQAPFPPSQPNAGTGWPQQ